MYLTYEEYQNMGGSLTEAEFENYAFEAQTIIDWYTFNRLKKDTTFSEDVKRCVFALIKLVKLKADTMTLGSQTTVLSDGSTVTTHAAIASQSNDGVSISYNSMGASEIFNSLAAYKAGGEVEATVQRYLSSTLNEAGKKLLYRGVYPDE
jgi:hypothetical protein